MGSNYTQSFDSEDEAINYCKRCYSNGEYGTFQLAIASKKIDRLHPQVTITDI